MDDDWKWTKIRSPQTLFEAKSKGWTIDVRVVGTTRWLRWTGDLIPWSDNYEWRGTAEKVFRDLQLIGYRCGVTGHVVLTEPDFVPNPSWVRDKELDRTVRVLI